MGVRQIYLEYLDNAGVFKQGCSVFDIGVQNLFMMDKNYVIKFLKKYGITIDKNIEKLAYDIELGGGFDPVGQGFNTKAFLGVLLSKAGMNYQSIDVFEHQYNIAADLNTYNVPKNCLEKFDLTLNFGTTEHIVNQYNCFKVIHDVTKVGGYIFHQVPAVGCIDHGYFVYCPQLFFDIANSNSYKIIETWYSGPYPPHNVYDTLKNKQDSMYKSILPDNNVDALTATSIPDATINVLMRKVKSCDFTIMLELNTSIHAVSDAI